jgi:hypothetical protein
MEKIRDVMRDNGFISDRAQLYDLVLISFMMLQILVRHFGHLSLSRSRQDNLTFLRKNVIE